MAHRSPFLRRSQGALEYLITYGWAILIIVIIGGALFSLGVFNPSTWGANKRATGFSSFELRDWKLNASGIFLAVANRFGDSVTITNVSALRSSAAGGTSLCAYNVTAAILLPVDGSLALPATYNVTSCASGLSAGEYYSLSASIHFGAGTLNHTDSGTITGKFEQT